MECDTPEFRSMREAKRKKKERRAEAWARARAVDLPDEPETVEKSEEKTYLFVYGSLMDPTMLKLLLNREPELYEAWMKGYKVMMWGPYPALVEVGSKSFVHGKTFEIESEEEFQRLQRYETSSYRRASCFIRMDGMEDPIVGATFLWNGSEEELNEGEFNLEKWQKNRLHS